MASGRSEKRHKDKPRFSLRVFHASCGKVSSTVSSAQCRNRRRRNDVQVIDCITFETWHQCVPGDRAHVLAHQGEQVHAADVVVRRMRCKRMATMHADVPSNAHKRLYRHRFGPIAAAGGGSKQWQYFFHQLPPRASAAAVRAELRDLRRWRRVWHSCIPQG